MAQHVLLVLFICIVKKIDLRLASITWILFFGHLKTWIPFGRFGKTDQLITSLFDLHFNVTRTRGAQDTIVRVAYEFFVCFVSACILSLID